MKVIYFSDRKTKQLYPITLTRKASEITCGGYTLEDLVQEILGPSTWQYVKANLPFVWKLEDKTLWLNARIVPRVVSLLKLKKALGSGKRKGKLSLLNYPWEVIRESNRILKDNLTHRMSNFTRAPCGVYVGEGVEIHKHVVFDCSEGPIILDSGVKVSPFVSLKGPLYVGAQTKIKEFTTIAHASVGEVCKLAGDIEESVIEGFTNKQHYGFVGHSYLGSWVNLGAGTTFSDLKNTYGEIKVKLLGKRYPTGTQFFGAIVGDYVKTAINTSISSGMLIGPNSFLYGYVTENVPPFTNYYQGKMVEFYLEEAYKVQARMFARRDLEVKKEDQEILKIAFDQTKGERRKYGVEKGYFKL